MAGNLIFHKSNFGCQVISNVGPPLNTSGKFLNFLSLVFWCTVGFCFLTELEHWLDHFKHMF